MDYHDLIKTLREPPEDGVPASIYDDLTTAYDDLRTGSEAKVSELDQRVKSYESEISQLKARNYDLLMRVSDNSGDDADKDTQDDPPERSGIESLFHH